MRLYLVSAVVICSSYWTVAASAVWLSVCVAPIVGSASPSPQPGLVDECAFREASGFIGTIGGPLSQSDLEIAEEVIQGTCIQDLGLAAKEGLGQEQAAIAIDHGTRRAMAALGISLADE